MKEGSEDFIKLSPLPPVYWHSYLYGDEGMGQNRSIHTYEITHGVLGTMAGSGNDEIIPYYDGKTWSLVNQIDFCS